METEPLNSEDPGHKKSGKRNNGAIIAVLLFVVIMAVGLVLAGQTRSTRVRLSDGRLLEVTRVYYGKFDQIDHGSQIQSASFMVSGSPPASPTGLAVWLTIGRSDALPSGDLFLVDSHEDLFAASSASYTYVSPFPFPLPFVGPRPQWRFDFTNFPRNERTLRFRYYDMAGNNLGEFTLPNPAHVVLQQWSPEKLPTSRMVDTQKLVVRSAQWRPSTPAMRNGVKANLPPLQIDYGLENSSRPGQPALLWGLYASELTDSAGNIVQENETDWKICPRESVYKFTLKLARSAESLFAPEETWTLPDVPLPAPGELTLLKQATTLSGVQLTALSLTVAPTVIYDSPKQGSPNLVEVSANGVPGKKWNQSDASSTSNTNNVHCTVDGTSPQVALVADGLQPDQHLNVWATVHDERQRTKSRTSRYNQKMSSSLVLQSERNVPQKGYRNLEVRLLPIPLSAKKVDLHFSITKIKNVEFYIHPDPPK